MTKSHRVARTLALAIAVPLLTLVPGPVCAQTPVEPVVQSWALAPTGTDPNEPSSRPNLTYEMAPGATMTDSVTLWNYGNTQLTFRIYSTDAFNNTDGVFDLLPGDKTPVDVGSWVQLPQPNVTVAARTKIDLPFTLTVPPGARSGDHAAAILASSQAEGRSDDGGVVTVDRRTGSRLYLRVAGPLQPQLAVEEIHTAYRPSPNPLDGSFDVAYTVRNVGNVRLGAHHQVAVQNPFGRKMKTVTPADLVEILPGNAIVVRTRFEHVTAAVRLTTKVVVTPFTVGNPVEPSPTVTGTGHVWAIPWSAIAVVALGALVWRWYRARRVRQVWPEGAGPDVGGEEREMAAIS